jgi:hypothetical protein
MVEKKWERMLPQRWKEVEKEVEEGRETIFGGGDGRSGKKTLKDVDE